MNENDYSSGNDTTVDIVERLGGKALVGFHRSTNLHIDASEYLDLYQKLLARGLYQTTVIYLDTKFWIILRDAVRKTNSAGTEVLSLLRRLVRERRVLCICQAASFLELAKQSPDSLHIMSSLVDELSESVSIVSVEELRTIEATNYVCWKLGETVDQQHKIWTHLGLILHSGVVQHLGEFVPQQVNQLSVDVILKSTIDSLWQASMEDIMTAFDWKTSDKLCANIDQTTIDKIEIRKKERKKKNLSLEAIRKYEFETIIPSTYHSIFFRIIFSLRRAIREPIALEEQLKQAEDLISYAVNEAVTGELNHYIPGVVVLTHLYCLYEHDTNKKLTSNDWFDMNHASVALPYADLFFTEKHLEHQICNVLKFDKEYKCKVVFSIEEAIVALNQI